jgi:hypothetical protein
MAAQKSMQVEKAAKPNKNLFEYIKKWFDESGENKNTDETDGEENAEENNS